MRSLSPFFPAFLFFAAHSAASDEVFCLPDLKNLTEKLTEWSKGKSGKMQQVVANCFWYNHMKKTFPLSCKVGVIVPVPDESPRFTFPNTSFASIKHHTNAAYPPFDKGCVLIDRHAHVPDFTSSVALMYAHAPTLTDLEPHIALQIVTMALSGVKHLYITRILANEDEGVYDAYMDILEKYPVFDTVIFTREAFANDRDEASISSETEGNTKQLERQPHYLSDSDPSSYTIVVADVPAFPTPTQVDDLIEAFTQMERYLVDEMQTEKMKSHVEHIWTERATAVKLTLEDLQQFMPETLPTYDHTEVTVRNQDCVEVASALCREGYSPLLVNSANADEPGGGTYRAAAQEQEIFRKTTLSYYLMHNKYIKPGEYPMEWYQFRYSPFVTVLRTRNAHERLEWIDLDRRVTFGVITSAPFVMGELPLAPKEYASGTRIKIMQHFAAALAFGHDSIVTGAYDLGAFGGDVDVTLGIFKEMLNLYDGYFKRIDFAIVGETSELYDRFKTELERSRQ